MTYKDSYESEGENNEESIDIIITGHAKEKMEKAAEVLEVDSVQPILTLMVGMFCETVAEYGKDENYRDLALIDPETMKAVKLCDLEELRVRAKLIEYDQQAPSAEE